MDYTELEELKEDKTPEQKKVIDYFLNPGCGCLNTNMSDDQYSKLVRTKRDSFKFRETALNKIGLDEDELKEIPPAELEGYVFRNAYAKQRANGKWVSSTYQVAWCFFSSTQVYLYRCSFNLHDGKKSESTDEFFYKDVTSISTHSAIEETKNLDSKGRKQEIESHSFVMIVPGDKLIVAMDGVEDADSIIQAMKQKLREKKNS